MRKILIIALLALSTLAFKCNKSSAPSACPAGRQITTANNICLPSQWAGQVDRPAGGWIFIESGASDEQKALIGQKVEAGLRQTIEGALLHNPSWTKYTTTDHYGVVMIKSQATNQDGTPALVTNGIQTAGTVINAYPDGNPRGGEPVIVLPLPDQWPAADSNYWNYLQASARNEGEHVIEWKNDLAEFLNRAISADIHPHWPLADGSLAKESVPACALNFNPKVRPAKLPKVK